MPASSLLPLALLLSTPARADLDLAFVLDTTGSMSGEIEEARTRIRELALALAAARPGERIRFGVVAYRDQGDAYVTLVSPLVEEVELTWRFLNGLSANGGGDHPEDLVEGLRVAMDELAWDPDAERVLFLVGDAPAHLDYADHEGLDSLARRARAGGLVVNAIGCRSLPEEGVEQFRSLAYATEGQYHHIGRVEADQGGLAEAMLQTLHLVPTQDGPRQPLRVYESRQRPAQAQDSGLSAGVLVRLGAWSSSLEKEPEEPGQVCTLSVLLPEGVALAAPPALATGDRLLHVDLDLAPGAGSRSLWELERCLPATTPVQTTLR